MTGHVFVAADGRPHGRWLAAFPDAHVVASADAAARHLQPGDLLWCLDQRAEALQDLRARQPQSRLVVLSMRPDREATLAAFQMGARAYCHALSTADMLRDVAVVVEHGGLWLGPELLGETVRNTPRLLRKKVNGSAWSDLTSREREVGNWIVRGASNREISAQLGIRERTVKAHLAAIFDKLQVRDRLQLAVKLGEPRSGE